VSTNGSWREDGFEGCFLVELCRRFRDLQGCVSQKPSRKRFPLRPSIFFCSAEEAEKHTPKASLESGDCAALSDDETVENSCVTLKPRLSKVRRYASVVLKEKRGGRKTGEIASQKSVSHLGPKLFMHRCVNVKCDAQIYNQAVPSPANTRGPGAVFGKGTAEKTTWSARADDPLDIKVGFEFVQKLERCSQHECLTSVCVSKTSLRRDHATASARVSKAIKDHSFAASSSSFLALASVSFASSILPSSASS
jgi:hypothetical protein